MAQQIEHGTDYPQSVVVRAFMTVFDKQRAAARRRRAINEAGGLNKHLLRDIMADDPKSLSVAFGPGKAPEQNCC